MQKFSYHTHTNALDIFDGHHSAAEMIHRAEEIGYEDCFYGEGLCLIEWANLIEEILPEKYTEIRIEKDLEKGFDYRKITVTEVEA